MLARTRGWVESWNRVKDLPEPALHENLVKKCRNGFQMAKKPSRGQKEAWVTLLAARLQSEGYRYRVVNGSISGDTTAGGRARLPTLLSQHKPAIVILELGGNDALRGGNLAATRTNLEAMVVAAQFAKAKVLIVGMQLPPNYGLAYVREFNALFGDVAKAQRVPIVPTAAGFGDDFTLFQPDLIHPTAAAQPRLLDNVWPVLQPLLRK
jgi:acyl-CoA thioesterase-1